MLFALEKVKKHPSQFVYTYGFHVFLLQNPLYTFRRKRLFVFPVSIPL